MNDNSTPPGSTHNARIASVIEDLKSQDRINYSKTAKKWKVEQTTLAKQYKGQTGTIQEKSSTIHKRLTNEQELVLIEQINKLTLRGILPTSRIVRNLAEEVVGGPVGKNWNACFIKRNQKELKSAYLCTIDNARSKADYAPSFRLFYDLVIFFFRLLLPSNRVLTNFLN